MANEVVKTEYRSAVQKVTDSYISNAEQAFKKLGQAMTPRQKQLVAFAVQKTQDALDMGKKTWKDLNPSSITTAFTQIAMLGLNLNSYPAQAYLAIRGDKITFAPQGDGWRSIVDKYGVNIKTTHTPWIVREGDKFIYPHYKGIEIVPPEWTPQGAGKTLRIVCPIEFNDGHVEYLIAEREDVKVNLLSAINNNLTKGFEKNYDSYNKCLKIAENKTLDELLHNEEFCTLGKLSPAWRGPAAEQMIITKMKNNIYKKIHTDDAENGALEFIDDDDGDVEPIPMGRIDVSEDKPEEEPKKVEVPKGFEKTKEEPAPKPKQEQLSFDTAEDDGKDNADFDEDVPF